MEISINVFDQKLRVVSNLSNLISGTQRFIKFKFFLSDEWKDLKNTIFAQFTQNGVAYNQYLDSDNCVYLPPKIKAGTCTMMLYGSYNGVIGTSNFLTFKIDENILIDGEISSNETTDTLYQQLMDMVAGLMDEDGQVAKVVEDTAVAMITQFLEEGKLANMTIEDGSISLDKVDEDFKSKLDEIDDARSDIYAYADNAATDAADDVKTEIEAYLEGGYKTAIEEEIENSADGVVTEIQKYLVENYLSKEYKPFEIEIVPELPKLTDAKEMKYYLIPKDSGNGYDKHWVVNDNGVKKWDDFGSSSTVVVSDLPDAGETDVDYILNTGEGYQFWKWINNDWKIISGASALVLDELPESGDAYTDYYVLEDDLYVHYRYINNEFVQVGGAGGISDEEKAEISTAINNMETDIETIGGSVDEIRKYAQGLNSRIDNINIDTFKYTATYKDNIFSLIEYEEGKEEERTVVSSFTITGGSGNASSSNLEIEKRTASPITVSPTDKVEIRFIYSSKDSSGDDVDGGYTWKKDKLELESGVCDHGENVFDVTKYLDVGINKFHLYIVDDANSQYYTAWTVNVVDVRIESDFPTSKTYEAGKPVKFTYTPWGANIAKTVHFFLDGKDIGTVETTDSGLTETYEIPAQEHGAHLLECYITANINGKDISTDHIYKDIVWFDPTSDKPVIGCDYREDCYGTIQAKQYEIKKIPIYVFDPKRENPSIDITEEFNNEIISSKSEKLKTPPLYNLDYKSSDIGDHKLSVSCGGTEVNLKVNIEDIGVDARPVTDGLELDFNPFGITNGSEDRNWSYGDYKMTVSDNFDWINGGYKTDENGDPYFLVKSGTTATFNYEMFSSNEDRDPKLVGSELKLIFKTENVQNADAVWFTNVEKRDNTNTVTGIQLGVHNGWLKTNNASNSDVGEGENKVLSTNTYLYIPYCEDEIIELDINIEPNGGVGGKSAFIMAYEDGVPSKAYVYDNSDILFQAEPKPIVIGSEACDVRIYRLKLYSKSLTTENIMRNFIADSRDPETMVTRYNRNSIYYNASTQTYSPYRGGGYSLDPVKIAPMIPNVKVLMLEADQFTDSKNTFIKSNLRCIHASGGSLYSGDPYLDNWYFEYGYHSGQGTTSNNYGTSGRNVDFLFNCDGIHKPSNKVDAEEDYISQVTMGYGTSFQDPYPVKVTNWKGKEGKVALTRTSVPNNFFNFKVNVASSENANNALLQKRYNDFLPYISPASKRDPSIKNDMEFVPAILFIKEKSTDLDSHREFNDTEWHFYALGNLGDSKKTDYTRAYDPEDINEFTIEISDNTENNATFQTGVYLDNGQPQFETGYLSETYDENGETDSRYVSYENPQTFVYPISPEAWNENNLRYKALYEEGFDGNHSFEPRYACCGDYRDGKLVNDTGNGGNAQVERNNDVWRAFYRWVITSTDEQFKTELDEWCVRDAVEFFYAFTHYYTMMDNRAKNTFWHFAKTGKHRIVSRPVSELLHIYCEYKDGNYVKTEDKVIDGNKTYYTEYAFDLWDYDNDTALGINNNGELTFPYGREDDDYNILNDKSSGYVFNGARSVFWCRLRDLLKGEITKIFTETVDKNCFSSTNLIKQFDTYQECYPEEVWRLDIERKYLRTFLGTSIDNSKPKEAPTYLRDMMQGRKKYQRRQWIRDQEIYFGTKHKVDSMMSGGSDGRQNRITFRCYLPSSETHGANSSSLAVEPNYTLRIVPYSDMYVTADFGGTPKQLKTRAGQECLLDFKPSDSTDTQVVIYAADRIQALNDLSACYLTTLEIGDAERLKTLVVGNENEKFNNPRFTTLTLGNNKLLEKLDIRNCKALAASFDFSNSVNLSEFYAEGSGLKSAIFAPNGKLRLAYLPNTKSVTALSMRNLNNLNPENFKANLDVLETLTLQGGRLDNKTIVEDVVDTLLDVSLYDIDWVVPDTVLLNKLVNVIKSTITGKIEITGQVRNQELAAYKEKWGNEHLEIIYDSSNVIPQHKVTYVNDDEENTVLYEYYVDRGSKPIDPVENGNIPIPKKESTAQYDFEYSGWENITNQVLSDIIIKAKYTSTVRQYRVSWYKKEGGDLLGSLTVDYGDEAIYPKDETPTDDSGEATLNYSVFAGWDKSTGYVTQDIKVYAKWETGTLPPEGTNLKDMSIGQICAVTKSGKTSEYFDLKDYIDITLGHDFDFYNVDSEVLAENLYLDGTEAVDTNITLFGENDRSFTLAIDYQFSNTKLNDTLVSCFDEDGSEGFRLRYNNNPEIQWGNRTQKFGNGKMRDIVVIRHRKGEDRLYVYASNSTSASQQFDLEVLACDFVRSRNTTTDQVLTFGAVRYGDGGHDYYAKGHIHWCKIWYDDLGETNAIRLASWYRESIRMEFCGSGLYKLNKNSANKVNASFICNHILEGRGLRIHPSTNNEPTWANSDMRVFLNTKFLHSLPIAWQSMLKSAYIKSVIWDKASNTLDTDGTNDNIYLPSYSEVYNSTAAQNLGESTLIEWFTTYQSRLKFEGYKIPEKAKFYLSDGDPSESLKNDVKTGDVWLKGSSSSGANTGYIYVSKEYLDEYNITPKETAHIGGGWIISSEWYLRSAYESSNDYNFWREVSQSGSLLGTQATSASGICPCFSI